MDTRKNRRNGWDSVINAYMNKLPGNWPYTAVVTDPRIRTTILEKTARLLNTKLKGRLVPREGGDVIKAKINNALLDFQWDQAVEGGSMIEKIAQMDQIARLFGSAFAMPYWKYDYKTSKGETEVFFEGNEFKVIDPRDIFVDPTCLHVRSANWVQIREFTDLMTIQIEHERAGENSRWKNLNALKKALEEDRYGNRRDSEYYSQVKSNRGLEDRMGTDPAFPTFEMVTEWRRDRRVMFAPKYGIKLKDEPNPYEHMKIPVVQLRYYPIPDDVWGESEVEGVMPIQRAINAILCGFIDEMNLKMRPPLKIAASGVRMETIEYGPQARWIMNNPATDVIEMAGGGDSVRNFNSSYSALVAAFNTAMGETSLGVSNVGNFQKDKTATEVRKLENQQNHRDQYNQLYLSQMLKDTMMMWLTNNKQFLLSDPDKHQYILRIVGKEKIKRFAKALPSEDYIPAEAMRAISEYIIENPKASNREIDVMAQSLTIPESAVVANPEETDPAKYDIKPKFEVDDDGDTGVLYIEPEDLEGVYDYIPDVESMAAGANQEMQKAKQEALETVLNPAVQQMLQLQGETVKLKELLVDRLEDAGYADAAGLFESIQGGLNENVQGGPQASPASQAGGSIPGVQDIPGGSAPVPSPTLGGGLPQTPGI